MDDESVSTFRKMLETDDYDHAKDSNSKRTKSIKKDFKKRVDKIQNPTLALAADENEEEYSDLEGQVMKIIIPSNIIDIWTRLEVLLGLKLSGHIDILTEAGNLIEEIYKRGEIKDEQHYRNPLDKFRTN